MARIKTLSADVTEPKLTTNLNSLDFIVNTPIEFEFTTVAGSKQGTMVKGHSEFNDAEALEKLEYYETSDEQWHEFSGNDFGPAEGFPLSDATSRFRATFNKSGTYIFTAYVATVEGDEHLAECEAIATVRVDDAALTTNIDSVDFVLNTPTEFTFTSVAGSNEGLMVKGVSESIQPEVFTDLEYYDEISSEWKAIPSDSFGTEGLPLYNATLKFRMTFIKAGSYPFKIYMKAVNNEAVLATCSATATARATDTVLTTNINELDFVVGTPVEFDFTTTAGSNQGIMIKGTSEFDNEEALEKLEYYEVKDGTWKEFSGDFGASSGFPLSDATSKFRATFKKAGTYKFTAYVYAATNNARIAECEATATVRAEDSQLTTNIGDVEFIVGVPAEFTFSTVAGSNQGLMVKGSSEFNEPDAIEKLEYYEVNDGKWYEFSGDFGPSSGFPMSDATSKFRVTFNRAGNYTFTANVKSVNNEAVIASCEVTANVRDYVKSEIASTFNSSEEVKVTTPYEFTVTITPNDDAGKTLIGKISFSTEEYTLEKLDNKKYVSFDGNIEDVLANSEYKFRVTFHNYENVTMKFSILNEDSEYVKLEQELSVIDLTFPTATISLSNVSPEEHETFDITVSVTANDYINKTGSYLYTFSSVEDIKSVEKYENNSWVKIDRTVLNTPEERTIKSEDLKLRVSFYNLGNYTVSFSINDRKLAETQINVVDNVEETETAKVTTEALKGGQVRDVIYNYGIENSWTQEEINAAIAEYKNDFGRFALDNGLITKDEEKKFLDYTTHYTLIDSVIKLGIIDLKKNRGEIKDLILSTKDGVDEVLETLNNKYI